MILFTVLATDFQFVGFAASGFLLLKLGKTVYIILVLSSGKINLENKWSNLYSFAIACVPNITILLNANVTLKNTIDNSLLGGFKIQVEDYILDDSMKNRLEKLKENITLKKGEND
jgi:hypothetical protein